ncbi:MAG: hypothetical protein M3065_00835 [Actinomycetota bacterium]|nr:hypothetical protein [Actinomycetota bacterium]
MGVLVAGVDGDGVVEVVVWVVVGEVFVKVVVEVDVELVCGCVTVEVEVAVLVVLSPEPALHCLSASLPTVLAPLLRSCTSVRSVEPGRFAI